MGGIAAACARCTRASADVPHNPMSVVLSTNGRATSALVATYENFDGRDVPAVWLPERVSDPKLFQHVKLGIAAAAALDACTQE